MATDAEATAAGFILPKGTDLIRDGDDAISNNAKAATELAKNLDTKILNLIPAKRIALHQLSMPGNNNLNDVAPSRHVRVPVKFFVTITKWELVLKNYNDRTGKNYGRIDFASVYIGERAQDENGNYTANYAEGTRVNLGVPVIAGVGTSAERYVIYDIEYPFEANKEYVIGYAYTHTNAASHMGIGGSYLGTLVGGVSSYDVTNDWSPNTPLDVYIKPEISDKTPFYAYPGSSSETGSGSEYPLRDVWTWRHAEAYKAVPALIGQSGSLLSTWVDSGNYIRQKFTTIARADKVIGNPGSNDIYSGQPLPEVVARYTAFTKWVRSHIGDTLEAVDVFPRSTETAAIRDVRLGFNDHLYSLPNNILQCHMRSEAVINDQGMLDNKYNSGDNVHLNTAGQHQVGAAVISGVANPSEPVKRYTIDETAGRTVTVWDYLNNREQLIYGDTGWRNVTALTTDTTYSTTGGTFMRRVGNTVFVDVVGATSAIAGTGAKIDLLTLPNGFRASRETTSVTLSGNSPLSRALTNPYGGFSFYSVPNGQNFAVAMSWGTTNPWPTSLPGVAA